MTEKENPYSTPEWTEVRRKEIAICLLALSLQAPDQIAMFPVEQPFLQKANELAIEYNIALLKAKDSGDLSEIEVRVLGEIDDLLGEMSDARDESLWSDEAILTHPKWAEVRNLARAAQTLVTLPTVVRDDLRQKF